MRRWIGRQAGRQLGFWLLAIWLILTGLEALAPALAGLHPLLALLAIAAGLLLLAGR